MNITENNFVLFFECEGIQEFNPLPFYLTFAGFPLGEWYYKVTNPVISDGLHGSMDIDLTDEPLTIEYIPIDISFFLGSHPNRPLNYQPIGQICTGRTAGINHGSQLKLNIKVTIKGNPPTPNPNPIKKPYDNATHKG